MPALTTPSVNLYAVLPQMELLVFGLLVLLAAAVSRDARRPLLNVLATLGLVLATYTSITLWSQRGLRFDSGSMFMADRLAVLVNVLLCLGALVTLMISGGFLAAQGTLSGEYYALILFAVIGMGVMASTADLMIFFLGLETFSISLYILCGFARGKVLSAEASLKYFLLGSFASGFLLYGIALVYGATGTTNLVGMTLHEDAVYLYHSTFPTQFPWNTLLTLGWGLILVGLAFKVGLVPFHLWTPDVYEGAPTPITAFMSVGVKAAAFTAFLRVMTTTGLFDLEKWTAALSILAVLTMCVGNVVALSQRNLKRLLAYSSIAHAGYITLGIISGRSLGAQAVLFYLVSYTIMNLGAFAFVIFAGAHHEGNLTLDQCKGLGFTHPLPAAMMTVFMLSLAGLPPTVGFLGKLYLFQSVVQAGDIPLAIIAVLNSVVAVYYYLRIVVMMYMHEHSGHDLQPSRSTGVLAATGVCAFLVLLLGLFPSKLIEIVKQCL